MESSIETFTVVTYYRTILTARTLPTWVFLFNTRKKVTVRFYGTLPFVASEVLVQKTYKMESDIYSFDMIMWEVLYGEPVTNRYDMNDILSQALKILDGFRPPVDKVIPQFYADVMERC
ncbi:hypothetical protein C2G38_2152204 [Gigaspora rosea]|uniref:Protein kinase domain-containing protein n=1 Tax=Gigaspora rosea TaxID=44941 RepID=A0A397W8J5_9GLOM|nr:hypothetical protein C2G38_2152204 [Gigaspora rosea]